MEAKVSPITRVLGTLGNDARLVCIDATQSANVQRSDCLSLDDDDDERSKMIGLSIDLSILSISPPVVVLSHVAHGSVILVTTHEEIVANGKDKNHSVTIILCQRCTLVAW